NDRLLEGSETVDLKLQNLGNPSHVSASLGVIAHTSTISDDESATLSIDMTDSVTETGGGQNVGVTLTITGTGSGPLALGPGVALTADVADALTGTATSGTDYTAFGTPRVTFNPGDASGTTANVTLTPLNDALLEGNETVNLT